MPDDIFYSISRADVWAEIQAIGKTVTEIRNDQLIMRREQKSTETSVERLEVKLDTAMERVEKRLSGLDMKFYGVLAGLIAGGGYVVIGG